MTYSSFLSTAEDVGVVQRHVRKGTCGKARLSENRMDKDHKETIFNDPKNGNHKFVHAPGFSLYLY